MEFFFYHFLKTFTSAIFTGIIFSISLKVIFFSKKGHKKLKLLKPFNILNPFGMSKTVVINVLIQTYYMYWY